MVGVQPTPPRRSKGLTAIAVVLEKEENILNTQTKDNSDECGKGHTPPPVRMKNLKLLQVHTGKKSTDQDSPKESGFWTYTSPTLIM